MLVYRAAILQYGKILPLGEGGHGLLVDVEHRTDLNDPGPVQMGHRLETADPALVNQGHHKSFHGIVKVVPQCQLVAVQVQQSLIEGPSAHLGAHGAGILFLPIVENDGANLRFDDGIGHIQLPAQLLNTGIIHTQAHINGDGLESEFFIMVAPQSRQKP